jgi:hypothetical protein
MKKEITKIEPKGSFILTIFEVKEGALTIFVHLMENRFDDNENSSIKVIQKKDLFLIQ